MSGQAGCRSKEIPGAVKAVSLFCMCWVLPNVIIFSLPLPEGFAVFNLVSFLAIAFYLILASSLAHRLMTWILEEPRGGVILSLCFSIGLFLVLCLLVLVLDNTSITIASLSTANLLFFGGILGTLLSSAVNRAAELVPICITAAIADLVSVLRGPTRQMIEDFTAYYQEGMAGPPPLVDFIIIKVGIPGYDIPMPLFGLTDWILLVLLSSSMLRLNVVDNLLSNGVTVTRHLYLPVAAVALFIGIVFAHYSESFVPAMVFISSVFLLFLLVKLKVYKEMTKTDVLYSIFFPALVIIVILVFGQSR